MSESIRAALGERIKELRKKNGLTQAKLALMINVEQSYLSKLELGSRNPSLSLLEKIADAYGITLSELFDGLQKDDSKPGSKGPGTASTSNQRASQSANQHDKYGNPKL